MTRQPAKTNTVEIGGTVIAAFLFSDDAQFFARTANEAGMFELTNPGQTAVARDRHGNDLTPSPHTTR